MIWCWMLKTVIVVGGTIVGLPRSVQEVPTCAWSVVHSSSTLVMMMMTIMDDGDDDQDRGITTTMIVDG